MSRFEINLKPLIWYAAIWLALAFAVPAMAEFPMPDIPGFSNNYPRFNDVAPYERN
jgi:hypothetical protein